MIFQTCEVVLSGASKHWVVIDFPGHTHVPYNVATRSVKSTEGEASLRFLGRISVS